MPEPAVEPREHTRLSSIVSDGTVFGSCGDGEEKLKWRAGAAQGIMRGCSEAVVDQAAMRNRGRRQLRGGKGSLCIIDPHLLRIWNRPRIKTGR